MAASPAKWPNYDNDVAAASSKIAGGEAAAIKETTGGRCRMMTIATPVKGHHDETGELIFLKFIPTLHLLPSSITSFFLSYTWTQESIQVPGGDPTDLDGRKKTVVVPLPLIRRSDAVAQRRAGVRGHEKNPDSVGKRK